MSKFNNLGSIRLSYFDYVSTVCYFVQVGIIALVIGTVLVLLVAMIYVNLNKVNKGDTAKEKTVERLAIFTIIWIVITIFFFSSF